ncbi:MAG: GNAT family N-acetyltransferase [Brevirhabdus sp.]
MQITQHYTGAKGVYRTDTDPAAELTYSRAGEAIMIIDHTEVPQALRGTGAGRALVERVVEDARASGIRIVPLCPFAAAQFARHPEWRDVLDTHIKPKVKR